MVDEEPERAPRMPVRQPGDAARDPRKQQIARLIERIQAEATDLHGATFSSRSYADQPILKTGGDLARERQERGEKARQDRDGHPAAARQAPTSPDAWNIAPSDAGRPGRTARASKASGISPAAAPERQEMPTGAASDPEARRSWRRQAREQARTAPAPKPARLSATDYGYWDLMADTLPHAAQPAGGSPARPQPAAVRLPEPLTALRALERKPGPGGAPLSEGQLFIEQARLGADITDDCPYPGTPAWRQPRGYQSLNDQELRGYFTWRAAWRKGERDAAPATYAVLLAYELVCGIGVTDEADVPVQLGLLADLCDRGSLDSWYINAAWSISRWKHDYCLVHGLGQDDSLAASLHWAHLAQVLRQAEAAAIAEAGLAPQEPPSPGPEDGGRKPAPPERDELARALAELAGFSLERSPFIRSHRDAYDAVLASTFADLAVHCRRRRKTGLVDGLIGSPETMPFNPFVGVPMPRGWEGEERTIVLGDGCWVSFSHGRWLRHRPYSSMDASKDMKRLMRAVDAQMRLDWEFGRTLKEVQLPKYLRKIVVTRSRQEHEREQEAERHRFTIDVSKLAGIRSSAAVVREALLVDEERDEEPAVPQEAAPQAAGTRQQTAGTQDASIRDAAAPGGTGSKAGIRQASPAARTAEGMPGHDAQRPASTMDAAGAPAAIPDRMAAATRPSAAQGSPLQPAPAGQTPAGRTAAGSEIPDASPAVPAAAGLDAAASAGPAMPGSAAAPAAPSATAASGPYGLAPDERALIAALLAGKAPAVPARPGAPTIDMLVDGINEKLFDLEGDVILEFDEAGAPAVVEDYREDLKGALGL